MIRGDGATLEKCAREPRVPFTEVCTLSPTHSCTFHVADSRETACYFYLVLPGRELDAGSIASSIALRAPNSPQFTPLKEEDIQRAMDYIRSRNEVERLRLYSFEPRIDARDVEVEFKMLPNAPLQMDLQLGMSGLQSEKGWGIQRGLSYETQRWARAAAFPFIVIGFAILCWGALRKKRGQPATGAPL